MKFFNIVASFALAATAVLGEGYCGQKCDASKVPNQVLSAPLQLVAVVDQNNPNIKYEIGGTVIINDDCHFTVEKFYMFPGSISAKWVGSKNGASEGITLTKDNAVSAIDPNQPQTLTYDVSNINPFCPASLLNDVDKIQLFDSNFQLLASAELPAHATSGGSSSNGNNVSNTANNTNNNNNNSSSDATTSKWTMSLLGLTTVAALLLA